MSERDGSLVHVHGGSALLEHIAAAGIEGARLEWCDPVAFGPTPGGLTDEAWYQTRARYLAGDPPERDVDEVVARLREQDRALRAAETSGRELVIWVGPELFCQAILMRMLTLLPVPDASGSSASAISLVDPGDQPGQRGCGLGNQPAEALRALLLGRRPVAPDAFNLARRCWAAFTAPGARRLASLVADDSADWPSLPHLRAALQRHLQDLPDGATGLSTSETRLLDTLEQAPSAMDRGQLFGALAAKEARPFLTDTELDEILKRLGGGQPAAGAPLVTLGSDGSVQLAARGRDVLAGHDFWSAERWHGGVWINRDGESDDEDSGASPPTD